MPFIETVLMVHNHYQRSSPSGENASFEAELALLRDRGHRVLAHTRESDEIAHYSAIQKLGLVRDTVWSSGSVRAVGRLIAETKPDVAHFQNTFPLISPSAYRACRIAGVPVVQTLRNYRLFCPSAIFFRNGGVCEECVGKTPPWPGVLHGCYRANRGASAVVATMLTVHRLLGTWMEMVDLYVALTEFARQKFIQGGFPAEKIVVKPNFVAPDPGPGEHQGGYAIFVGRLSSEKGIETLLRAWERLDSRLPLTIVGDGPLAPSVARAAGRIPRVDLLGKQPAEIVYELLGQAKLLIFPSEWYETFGRVAVEAFAKGTPVVAARIGAIAELVEDGRTGLHFRPGDPDDLAAKVEWAWTHPQRLAEMGQEARREYESRYTAERNYELLLEIYRLAAARPKMAALPSS